MAEGAFDDRKKKPTAEDVAQALGRSGATWDALMLWMSEQYGSLTEEWRFADARSGWSVKVSHKSRIICYMLPCPKYFRVTMILAEKAVKRALASDPPPDVVATIHSAKKFPEGRVLRFVIRFQKELPPIRDLLDRRMSG